MANGFRYIVSIDQKRTHIIVSNFEIILKVNKKYQIIKMIIKYYSKLIKVNKYSLIIIDTFYKWVRELLKSMKGLKDQTLF